MYFSLFALWFLSTTSYTLAAPVVQLPRGLFTDIKNGLKNATVKGVFDTEKVCPSLGLWHVTLARVEVVKGIKDTQTALAKVDSRAKSTGNTDVSTLVAAGSAGAGKAHASVNTIGQALISGQTPSIADQKNIAIGIKQAQDAIQCMTGAIKKQDQELSADIAAATTALGGLRNGGESVIQSQNKTFTDLGLPADFDQEKPDCKAVAASVNATSGATSNTT